MSKFCCQCIHTLPHARGIRSKECVACHTTETEIYHPDFKPRKHKDYKIATDGEVFHVTGY